MYQCGCTNFMPEAPCLSPRLSECLGTASADQAQGRRGEDQAPLHFILLRHVPLGHVMVTIYSRSNVNNFQIKLPNMI